ncbi:MAG: type II secretion system protein [Cyanobacteria bacterium K_DeepCast_35m_m2_023]|nr:type II secretion system protein [Cyanobacteria bacterium K_DeepCast_35m_m2_023]
MIGVSSERQELLCSLIGLLVKLSLVGVVAISLMRLAVAYQERMERQGELSAVLNLEEGKLAKARDRYDRLFVVDGEQRLIREQNQWIAPNRLRVVWTTTP